MGAREEVLSQGGLLRPERRLQAHAIFPLSRQFKGLIIEDSFALGVEKLKVGSLNSFAAEALAGARRIYEHHKLFGSTEKDIEASDDFKAAGAEIKSTPFAVQRGVVSVAAPLSKRIGLSMLSLRCA